MRLVTLGMSQVGANTFQLRIYRKNKVRQVMWLAALLLRVTSLSRSWQSGGKHLGGRKELGSKRLRGVH